MTDSPQSGPQRRWMIAIDTRDVLGTAGGALVLAGAAAISWGLAAIVAGLGLVALAWRLSR